MTETQQGVLIVKNSLIVATLVGVAFSVCLSAVPLKAQGTNVAVIDISLVYKNHVRFRAQMDQIKAEIKAFEEQIKGERKRIQEQGEGLKLFNPGSREYKEKEQQVASMSGDLSVKMGLKRKDFLEREARIYYNTYLELQGVMRDFCERHRIGLVLRFNSEDIDPQQRDSVLSGVNRAVVFQHQLNITGEILKRVNAGTPKLNQNVPVGPQIPRGNRAQIPRRRN